MNDELVNEIKNLNMAVIKRLFSIHNNDKISHCFPSPLQFKIIDFLE